MRPLERLVLSADNSTHLELGTPRALEYRHRSATASPLARARRKNRHNSKKLCTTPNQRARAKGMRRTAKPITKLLKISNVFYVAYFLAKKLFLFRAGDNKRNNCCYYE